MSELPKEFIDRMRSQLGGGFDGFIKALSLPPVRGLRVNLLKQTVNGFASFCPWGLEPSGIAEEGFICDAPDGVGKHPLHAAGLFYMQEPSAMSAAALACRDIDDWDCMRVLDMCAAPGGKTGGVAARMGGKGILVSNEVVRSRAVQLARNVERLGIANVAVVNAYPDAIAERLKGFFDLVLVDAPCSGEGMFRKDEGAILEWSPEHVASCAVRQSAIMESAARCVAPGGRLVYSTCTFSIDENEGVIDKFLSEHGDFELVETHRLYPHEIKGEGHFAALLVREGTRPKTVRFERIPPVKDRNALAALDEFVLGTLLNNLPDGLIHMANSTLRLIPRDMPAEVLRLAPVDVGVELGEVRKGRLVPAHGFFMAELGQKYLRLLAFDYDDPRLAAFLSGNTLPCPEAWKGFAAVAVNTPDGPRNVGFGKAVDGVLKNHLPKGLYVN